MKTNEIFKNLRLKMEFNQSVLSGLLSIKQSTLSNYETGKRKPSLRVCYKIIKLAKLKGIELNIEDIRPDE